MRQWPPVTMPLPISRVHDRGGRRATTPDRRYVSSASFAYGQAGGTARRSRHGRRGLRRRRRRGWGHQRRQRPDPAGRHPELRRRPGAHRLQQQHLQGQRHLGAEHRRRHVPVQPSTPSRTSRSRWTTRSSTRPSRPARTRRRSSTRSRRTRSGRTTRRSRPTTSSTSGSSRTAPSRTTTSPRPPATTRSRASRAPTTARRSRSSSRTPSPTGRACSPGHPARPTTSRSARAAGTPAWTRSRRRSRSGGWFKVENYTAGQSLTLARNEKYFGPKTNLDSVVFRFLPESTTQPAALQNNEVDLIYPQPQLDQVTQVKALPDVTSEINFGLSFEHFDFNFKNEHLGDLNGPPGDRHRHQRPGAGRPHRQAVQRQGHPARQPHLADRPARVPGPLRPVRQGRRGRGRASCSRTPATPRAPTASTPRAARSSRSGISTTAGNKLRETQGELFQAQMKEIGVEIKIANARLAEVLRRVAAPGQLRHRQLRLGRHPVRHLRQPGHLPDRRRQQLRRRTRTRRSTTCSPRPTARPTRPSRPSWATRSTSS